MRRTKQGLILEKLLHGMKYRYALCWNGPNGPGDAWPSCYDCACCIGYVGEDSATAGCGCPCHYRIESMANSREMLMFLLALDASPEMPFVPKNYEDWMQYNRKLKAEHDEWRKKGNPGAGTMEDISVCCEACKMVQEMEARFEEHQKDPLGNCGTPCHICDEARAACDAARAAKEN